MCALFSPEIVQAGAVEGLIVYFSPLREGAVGGGGNVMVVLWSGGGGKLGMC